MVFDISKVSGIGDFTEKVEKERMIFSAPQNEKAFLVLNKNTIEVRCDNELCKVLQAKYESVMESRYFGRGGIEIVNSGQLSQDELCDLVRLSYNMTKEVK